MIKVSGWVNKPLILEMEAVFVSNFRYLFLSAISLLLLMLAMEWQSIWHAIDFEQLQPPLLAGLLFIATYSFLPQKHADFWMTFFHELTHALFAMTFNNKVLNFQVTAGEGGAVQGVGKGNWAISLSPYFFPVHTVILMLVSTIASYSWQAYLNLFVAVSYAFYLLTQKRDLGFHQTDLRKTGILYSTIMIIELNLIFLLILIFFLQGDLAELTRFIGMIGNDHFRTMMDHLYSSPGTIWAAFQ